jgi:hypothetical protein
MLIHKRVITRTWVTPKGRKSYSRINYNQVLCLYPWSMVKADNDTATVIESDVTCPRCLEKLGRR